MSRKFYLLVLFKITIQCEMNFKTIVIIKCYQLEITKINTAAVHLKKVNKVIQSNQTDISDNCILMELDHVLEESKTKTKLTKTAENVAYTYNAFQHKSSFEKMAASVFILTYLHVSDI